MVGIQRRKQPVKGIWKKWRYKQHIYSTWGSNFGDGDGDILRQHHSPWVPLFVTRAVSLGDPWVASRKKGPCWAPLWGLLQSSPNWWWCSCCKVDFVHIHCVQTVLDWVSASNTMRQCRASCFQPQESVPLIRFLLYDLYGLFFLYTKCAYYSSTGMSLVYIVTNLHASIWVNFNVTSPTWDSTDEG